MKVPVEKAIMMASIEMLRGKMFYGHIVQQLGKAIKTRSESVVPTIGVGKRRGELLVKLFVNSDFIESLFDKSEASGAGDKKAWTWLAGLMEHEVLHIVFEHLSMEFSDRTRGAIAADLSVNSCIARETLPEGGCFAEDYGFKPHMSTMWYYQNLADNKKFQQQCKDGVFGPGGGKSDAVDSHDAWAELKNDPIFKELVKDIIQKAKDLCNKDYGRIPAEVLAQIEDALQKKPSLVPWQRILRNFVASATESNLDYTMKRVSKRFGTRPGTRKEDVLSLAVAVDTSGSISDEQLLLFFNEIRWVWKNGANVTIYEADADIAAVYPFKGKFSGEVHGRGGTDLNPVLRAVEGKYDALIYFTDFYAPPLERKFRIQTLWVLHSEIEPENYPADWGRFVRLESGVAVAG
jgi:predicted metal-dependent peptidase